MAGGKEPIQLLLLKGKKHLTKKEIEERKAQEPKVASDKAVRPPTYLPDDLKKEFRKTSKELVAAEIFTNLDVDSLARFLISKKEYLKVSHALSRQEPTRLIQEEIEGEDGSIEVIDHLVSNDTYGELLNMHDKLFKQCTKAAADLGMTITSRCKIILPKPKEDDKPLTKEEKLFGESL